MSHCMKSPSFRAVLYLIISVLMIFIFYSINSQLVIFYMIFPSLSVAIFGLILFFVPIFDIIEYNSSKKYWEIRQDDDTPGARKKIWNFICSYLSLFLSNFLISIISIFFLYKLDFLSSNDPSTLIVVSTTIVILIRILTYSKKGIAREIGKGFKYAMFPFGFTLFLWDFLSPLIQKDPIHPLQSIYNFIISNIATIEILGIALLVITGLEPIFEIFEKINRSYDKRE